MQRYSLLTAALVTGAFALTTSHLAGDASAGTYVLQGEKGDTGDQGTAGISVTGASEAPGANCTNGGVKYTSASGVNYVCKGDPGDQGIQGIQGLQGIQGPSGPFSGAFNGDVNITGNMTLSGTATLGSVIVQYAYSLSDCPSGYARDSTCAPWAGGCQGIVLCKKGSDEMVKVGDFWIDRYEAAIVDATQFATGNCSGAGVPYGQSAYDYPSAFPRTGNFTAPMYACSLKSVKPSAYMTWFQAQEACALAGKQLCSNEEWQAAAAGTHDTTGTETGNQCHIAMGNTSARNTGLAGSTPGGTDSCISKWGTEDMVGNLYEWVSMWGQAGPDHGVTDGAYAGNVSSGNPGFAGFSPETSGDGDGTWNVAGGAVGCDRTGGNCVFKVGLPFAAFRGGDWNDGPQAGVFALYLANGPSYSGDSSIGVRCCRRH